MSCGESTALRLITTCVVVRVQKPFKKRIHMYVVICMTLLNVSLL